MESTKKKKRGKMYPHRRTEEPKDLRERKENQKWRSKKQNNKNKKKERGKTYL